MEGIEDYDFSFKIVVGGSPNVGKTNVIQRFANDLFMEESRPTLGIDFVLKDVEFDDKVVRCQIWDTAGQEKLKAIAKMYYKNANGVLFIFDITDRSSFEALNGWMEELHSNVPEGIPMVILGNKADLSQDRKVTAEEATAYAKARGTYYIEVSAKENAGKEIEQAVVSLLKDMVKLIDIKQDKANIRAESIGRRSVKITQAKSATKGQANNRKCC